MKEERPKCPKCGKFMKCTSYLSEGSSEMVKCKCSCGCKTNEGY